MNILRANSLNDYIILCLGFDFLFKKKQNGMGLYGSSHALSYCGLRITNECWLTRWAV